MHDLATPHTSKTLTRAAGTAAARQARTGSDGQALYPHPSDATGYSWVLEVVEEDGVHVLDEISALHACLDRNNTKSPAA